MGPSVEKDTPEVVVWHDEADRLAVWGCLDPTDGCMCRDCVLPPDVSNPAPAPLTTNETREDT